MLQVCSASALGSLLFFLAVAGTDDLLWEWLQGLGMEQGSAETGVLCIHCSLRDLTRTESRGEKSTELSGSSSCAAQGLRGGTCHAGLYQ